MSKAGKKVFEIDDLRREIFSYLRTRKSALICNYCDNVVKWDKKVKDYVIVNDNNFSNVLIPGVYCFNCYSTYLKSTCNIS